MQQFLQDLEDFWAQTKNNEFYVETSGSTGLPKALCLSKDKIVWSAKSTQRALNIHSNKEKILCCLPLNKVSGAMQYFRSKIWPAEIVFVNPSGNPLLNYESSLNCTVISLTPSQLFEILHNAKSIEKLASFSIVLIGGAAFDFEIPFLQFKQTRFYQTYGMTETYSHIALKELPYEDVYLPLDGVEIDINDKGCLRIKAPVTDNQWIDTQDLAKLTGAGFTFLGRIDNAINSGGIKIIAEQLESKIAEKLGWKQQDFFIHKTAHEKWGEQVVLVCKFHDDQIKLNLFEFLDIAERPKEVYFISQFVFTNQKLQRKQSFAQAVKII